MLARSPIVEVADDARLPPATTPMPSWVEPEIPTWAARMAERPDHHVVGDLDQVVELRAPADAGDAERGAVDAGVGADLDVVLHHHDADLRHLVVARPPPLAHQVEGEAEAVRADDAARLQDDAVAQHAALAHHHVVVEQAVGAHLRPGADLHPGAEDGARPDHGAGPDRDERHDLGGRVDPGGGVDRRRCGETPAPRPAAG